MYAGRSDNYVRDITKDLRNQFDFASKYICQARLELQLKSQLNRACGAATYRWIRDLHIRRCSRTAQQWITAAGRVAINCRCVLSLVQNVEHFKSELAAEALRELRFLC